MSITDIDIEVRWLWEHPWEIYASSESTITISEVRHSDPQKFHGGMGFWSLNLNNQLIDPEQFVLATAWSDKHRFFKSNLTSEKFTELLTATIIKTPLDSLRMAPVASEAGFDVNTHRKEREGKEDVFTVLHKDLVSACKSLGYNQNEIDPSLLDNIVHESMKDGAGTIEDCVSIFLKRRREYL